MKRLRYSLLLFFITLFLSACSYTPQEQAKYDEYRAYWEQNSGRGADASR